MDEDASISSFEMPRLRGVIGKEEEEEDDDDKDDEDDEDDDAAYWMSFSSSLSELNKA